MLRAMMTVLVGLFVLIDVAPAFAQAQDTVLMAQNSGRRTLFDMLFGDEPAAPPVVEQPQRPRQTQQTQSTKRPQKAAPPPPPPEPKVVKSPDAIRLAVFGDSLGNDLSKALDRFYTEDPNLVVVNDAVGDSGFVRTDYFDWDKTIGEKIAADSFDLAVVIIGINDRQEISANGQTFEPLTDGWKAVYQQRLTSFLNQLRAARKPVIWIGLPPMAKSEYSAAINQISNLQRLVAFSSGAEYLDIFERFLGEDGKYASYGPDVNGQNAKMRKDDGIHFAQAGADKLAFYLSQSVSNFYRGGAVTVAVADPLQGTDAAAMLRPPYQGLGQIRLLEVAGAVIPISRVPPRATDLVTAASVVEPAAPFTLDQLMTAPVGRVDAFGVGVDPSADKPAKGEQP